MNISDALDMGARRLRQAGLEDSAKEAEFLLAELLESTRLELLRHYAEKLPALTIDRFEEGLKQREARKPLSYIVGTAPFLDMTLRVTPDVLIPRPETEVLAERIWKALDACSSGQTLLDIGTGSGALLIALVRHRHVRRAWGLDISQKALDVAIENAQAQNITKECHWIQSDLLQELAPISEPVWAVANLPYIRRGDLEGLQPELGWEPRLALDGGHEGLEIVHRFLQQAELQFASGSILWLEVGNDQGIPLGEWLKSQQSWTDVFVEKDLSGWPRYVRATRK